MSEDSVQSPVSSQAPRWWPLWLILVSDVALFSWMRFWPEQSFGAEGVGWLFQPIFLLLFLIWLLGFSRLRWKTRGLTVLLLSLSFALFYSLFSFRGFTGEMVPLFDFRWAAKAGLEKTSKTPVEAKKNLDFPQFLGPNRNVSIPGVTLLADWDKNPPRKLWTRPVGTAWSGFVVKGELAVTFEQNEDKEEVLCYELSSGEIKWRHSASAEFVSKVAGDGPRSTPSIAKGRVVAYGATGLLYCLDLKTGKSLWTKDFVKEHKSPEVMWGRSCSPLILGDLVIVSAGAMGRSLVAHKLETGDFVWGAGDDKTSYSSPMVTTLCGQRQIVVYNENTVVGHDPKDGKILWQFYKKNRAPKAVQPIPIGDDKIIVSASYGQGARCLQIKKDDKGEFSCEVLWKTLRLKAKFSNVALVGDSIYGLDEGILVCLDVNTGKRRWKKGRYGHGQMLLMGKQLLIQTEYGELILMEADPTGPKILTRFQGLPHKTWNCPCLAAPYLILRSDSQAVCYELALEKPNKSAQ